MGRNTVFLTVTVSPELSEFVRARVASGSFVSHSEVVRAGLRALRREEPHDPWAPGEAVEGRKGPPGSAESEKGSSVERAKAQSLADIKELRERLPGLWRRRIAVLRLCEEYGIENARVELADLRRYHTGIEPDEVSILRIVVDQDPERIYPVTAEVAKRVGELLDTAVWLDEEPRHVKRAEGYRDRFVWLEETRGGSGEENEEGARTPG